MNINDSPLGTHPIRNCRKNKRSIKLQHIEREMAPGKFNEFLRLNNARRKNIKMSIIRWHISH
jgi:hypothetical protein